MLRNYITVALRALQRSPVYTAINIGGLAVAMAACLLIGLFVQQELSFDTFHENLWSVRRWSAREKGRFGI